MYGAACGPVKGQLLGDRGGRLTQGPGSEYFCRQVGSSSNESWPSVYVDCKLAKMVLYFIMMLTTASFTYRVLPFSLSKCLLAQPLCREWAGLDINTADWSQMQRNQSRVDTLLLKVLRFKEHSAPTEHSSNGECFSKEEKKSDELSVEICNERKKDDEDFSIFMQCLKKIKYNQLQLLFSAEKKIMVTVNI